MLNLDSFCPSLLQWGARFEPCSIVRTSIGARGRKRGCVEGREFGEPLLTVGEVAQLMRVSNMTVYRLIKSGQLSAIRVGKNYRIRRSDIERYLTERAVNVPMEPS